MPVHIQSLQYQDYPASVRLLNTACPERTETAEAWQRADEQGSETHRIPRRYAAVDTEEQTVLGYASIWPVRFPKFRMDLAVAAEKRRQGIGSLLFQSLLEDLEALGAATVQARAREDRTEALAFLNRRGFVETQRMRELRLDLRTADLSLLLPVIEALKQRGVEFVTLAQERERTGDYMRKLHDLQQAAVPTWPDPDPSPDPPSWSYEDSVRFFQGTQALPDAFYIARLGEQYLGYSGLATREDRPDCLDSAGTAVHPNYRRQGIALALKTLGLLYARQHGYPAIATRSANPAMIALNEKLGFRRGASEVRLVKQL